MREFELKNLFGTAVKSWRRRLGISQEELAGRAGLHRTYVSDVERGARNLSLESIDKLAGALEVSVATLFSRRDALSLVDILLVEDNHDDTELALRAFEKFKMTNRVQVVHDGADALNFLFCEGPYSHRQIEDHPQMVLLDLKLPKVGGMEVLRRIKGDDRTRTIPVVVLTVSQHDRDIAESRRLGAEAYIVKPVDFQRFSKVTPQLSFQWALLKSGATPLPPSVRFLASQGQGPAAGWTDGC